MSGIVVEFEVLPEETPGDRSAAQVYDTLHRQLEDPGSRFRSGEFGRFAQDATLTRPPGGVELSGVEPPRLPSRHDESPAVHHDMGPPVSSSHLNSGGFGAQSSTQWGHHGHHDVPPLDSASRYSGFETHVHQPSYPIDPVAHGLSNSELVDRISQLEQQLARTAAGGPGAHDSQPPPASARGRSTETDALEEKCALLHQRLSAVERELREAQESARTYRTRAEQFELKLKDREQLLNHAKEMWMKENVRASKLADDLTNAEVRLADQERRLKDVMERHNDAQQELRQLQHLFGNPNDGGLTGHKGSGFSDPRDVQAPHSSPDLALSRSRGPSFEKPPTSLGSLPEAETNSDRFRRLCILNDAVLFEDELIQIGVKMEYRGKEGQIAVYFGNKGSAALSAFSVQYRVAEDRALRFHAVPLSQTLEADKQVVQRVNVVFEEPFVEAPLMRVQFLLPDASPRRLQLRFPVMLTKFMLGRELSQTEFFRVWRQQYFVLNEVTSIVHLATRLGGALVNIARGLVLGNALRLHHGVDDNPDNFVLVGQLVDAPGPRQDLGREPRDLDWGMDRNHSFGRGHGHMDGHGAAAGEDGERDLALARVEVGSGRFLGKARVVVRSGVHAVAKAVCDVLVEQLAEAGAPATGGPAAR